MAWMFGFLTAVRIIAILFLPWYDQPQYYAGVYGIDGFFDVLMSGVRWRTVVFGLATAALIVTAMRVETKDVSPGS